MIKSQQRAWQVITHTQNFIRSCEQNRSSVQTALLNSTYYKL